MPSRANSFNSFRGSWQKVEYQNYSRMCAGAVTVTVLRDVSGAGRAAQYLSWHPDRSRRLAVAHATLVRPHVDGVLHSMCCPSA